MSLSPFGSKIIEQMLTLWFQCALALHNFQKLGVEGLDAYIALKDSVNPNKPVNSFFLPLSRAVCFRCT